MTDMERRKRLRDDLQLLVDESGVTAIVEELAGLCSETADALRQGGESEKVAQGWQADANRLQDVSFTLNH
jgi:hypothetical protein